jgi:hypothetical protein
VAPDPESRHIPPRWWWWLVSRPRKTVAKGYGEQHRRLRKKFARLVDAGQATCVRCGRPIVPGTLWDLGHVDGDRSRWSGPEHARCNRRTATHAAQRRLAGDAPKPIPADDPARNRFYGPQGQRWSRAWFDWRNE